MYLVIDVGGTFTKYGLLDAEGNIIEKSKVESCNKDYEGFRALVRGIYDQYEDRGLEGIALSVPGVVDVDSGVILARSALKCMVGHNVVEEVSELCGGIPTSVENDGKAAGLAETWIGAAKDVPNCVVLGFGTAIAGCVILDHKALRGNNMIAGEFSYMPSVLEKDNYGIFGVEWSTRGLVRKAAALMGREEMTGEEVFALYYQGEERVAKLMDEFFFQVACQCYSLQSVVDPDLFCIGGGISEQPCVVPGIQEACHYIYEHAKNPQQHEPQIVACKFNNDSNLIGALYSHLVRYGKL